MRLLSARHSRRAFFVMALLCVLIPCICVSVAAYERLWTPTDPPVTVTHPDGVTVETTLALAMAEITDGDIIRVADGDYLLASPLRYEGDAAFSLSFGRGTVRIAWEGTTPLLSLSGRAETPCRVSLIGTDTVFSLGDAAPLLLSDAALTVSSCTFVSRSSAMTTNAVLTLSDTTLYTTADALIQRGGESVLSHATLVSDDGDAVSLSGDAHLTVSDTLLSAAAHAVRVEGAGSSVVASGTTLFDGSLTTVSLLAVSDAALFRTAPPALAGRVTETPAELILTLPRVTENVGNDTFSRKLNVAYSALSETPVYRIDAADGTSRRLYSFFIPDADLSSDARCELLTDLHAPFLCRTNATGELTFVLNDRTVSGILPPGVTGGALFTSSAEASLTFDVRGAVVAAPGGFLAASYAPSLVCTATDAVLFGRIEAPRASFSAEGGYLDASPSAPTLSVRSAVLSGTTLVSRGSDAALATRGDTVLTASALYGIGGAAADIGGHLRADADTLLYGAVSAADADLPRGILLTALSLADDGCYLCPQTREVTALLYEPGALPLRSSLRTLSFTATVGDPSFRYRMRFTLGSTPALSVYVPADTYAVPGAAVELIACNADPISFSAATAVADTIDGEPVYRLDLPALPFLFLDGELTIRYLQGHGAYTHETTAPLSDLLLRTAIATTGDARTVLSCYLDFLFAAGDDDTEALRPLFEAFLPETQPVVQGDGDHLRALPLRTVLFAPDASLDFWFAETFDGTVTFHASHGGNPVTLTADTATAYRLIVPTAELSLSSVMTLTFAPRRGGVMTASFTIADLAAFLGESESRSACFLRACAAYFTALSAASHTAG